ncbi:uncharacterized protein LOC106013135, partial [Aplysia californica]|uniref:Uncharacterized protein LOC106013135 n=1 Tax=Aplysia californica TaxID=6500 RepID=A0ABM1A9R2_APLCA
MKEERLTTLPSILAEYSQEISNGEESSVKTQVKPNVGKENAVKSPKPERCKKKSVASKSDRAVSAGERRRRLETKRVEDKRLGQVADRWDQVCAEARVKRQELLARKVRLQHQLIQAQDKRAELRRHDEEEARRQVRSP